MPQKSFNISIFVFPQSKVRSNRRSCQATTFRSRRLTMSADENPRPCRTSSVCSPRRGGASAPCADTIGLRTVGTSPMRGWWTVWSICRCLTCSSSNTSSWPDRPPRHSRRVKKPAPLVLGTLTNNRRDVLAQRGQVLNSIPVGAITWVVGEVVATGYSTEPGELPVITDQESPRACGVRRDPQNGSTGRSNM